MDFKASLDYLYGLQRFGIKLGLENMQAIQRRLSLSSASLNCVHVAGTNGKGSVCAFLAEILKHSGLRVGLYTSPHLHCFNERIRVNGEPVSNVEIAALTNRTRRAATGLSMTFFEATTAMALLAFSEQQVDIAIIETGLGGRLDATNIVEPRLTVLTPISLDHCEHLGDTLPQIAAEKAGILKPGIPVVIGRQDPEALGVLLAEASRLGAPVCLAGRDFSWHGSRADFAVDCQDAHLDRLTCSLAGRHQLDNFAQAVAAAGQLRLRGISIPDDAIRSACRTTNWPGRLEWWGCGRKILADVAHNRAGVNTLSMYLEESKITGLHLVVGLSGRRDPVEVLKPLEKFIAAVYAVPVCFGEAVPTNVIAAWAVRAGLPVAEYASAEAGLTAACVASGENGPVVVCGSLYLVAELRQQCIAEGGQLNELCHGG